MKKNFYLLFILCLIFYGKVNDIYALEYNVDDIPNNTYIIGSYMYSDEIVLTTEHIMLASKTINSDNISDMIIYYKTPRGKWINGMTGDIVNISDKINIDYIDLVKQKSNILYGDVNEDSIVNGKDLILVLRYLANYDMSSSTFNLKNADINGDGVVNNADVTLLRKYLAGYFKDANLPEEPLGTTYIIEYLVDGDVYYRDYTIENVGIVRIEDPIKDGYIFDDWYIDEKYTTKYDFSNENITSNITLYAKFDNPKYGDVNEDGFVNTTDVVFIRRYLANYDLSSNTFNLKNADVNGDGVINTADVTLLEKYLAGYFKDANLPEEPLGTTYIIEYLVDGDVYYRDYTIENVGIVRIEDPIKDGYIFDDWYIDEKYTTKYDFSNENITSNITLYAKFK